MRLAILIAIVVAVPARAAADAETQRAMTAYFDGEQRGGFVLLGMGGAGLAGGAALYAAGGDLAKGAAYALLGLGAIHIAAGAFVYVSSVRRVGMFTEQIAMDPAAFRVAESKRMAGVSRQFLALKITWVVLIAGGIATAVIAHDRDRDQLAGAAIGIAGEAGATLVFDFVAARRAHRYRAALAPAVTADTRGGLLTIRAAF